MRVLLATDAWHPQINGVVRVFQTTVDGLTALGHEVKVLGPADFAGLPAPGYGEVRLGLGAFAAIGRAIEAFAPEAIHIPVEGPVGLAARRHCLKHGLAFTSSFHTRFADYFAKRLHLPPAPAYAYQRWFHRPAARFMVQTRTLETELAERGFTNIVPWGRAVDTALFRPWREEPGFDADFLNLPRPIFLYVGRVSPEKSLPDFLSLDLPGSKVVVGDGPALAALRARFPAAHFLGARHGEDLARHFSAADAFVFPSRFETFGLVVLEALACGTPVAALPVPGPIDIVGGRPEAVLSENLREAALAALTIDRRAARAFARTFSWEGCTRQFAGNLVPVR
ncbi:glycosyltransferase family 1 protein [Aurantimonas sp. Leaf443]|uniref:glycosyltransferase family 4 protein n=1 Tax=Aurantimonas sp. Leaf443 TaxID=1736378 RepID=UPI0006F53CF7|nr:glycosyltransferase family 1 protein [Aurantimonas sp. Leaf443]KQT85324.1 alpha-mannosyltransferase [Aurantimonas sp. Leaf443]